jgi:excisionase family DNA binding protein
MAQKYYNTAEVAKILGKSVDDVKRMVERRELHGYRDGADWKFKVEDIDQLAKSAPEEGGGDVLLSEVAMGQSDPGLSGTVIGMSGGPAATDSDIQLAGSDLKLAEDSRAKTPIAKPKPMSADSAAFEKLSLDDELTLDVGDSTTKSKPVTGGGSSVIDLGSMGSDDELVLGGSSSGSDVSIGGDSGISLVDPSDSGLSLETPVNLGSVGEESLELGEDSATSDSAALKTDDDFLLTPLEEAADISDSESGSQVIALDTTGEEAAGGMASMLDDDLSLSTTMEMGAVSTLAGTAVLGAQQGSLAEGASLIPSSVVSGEASYTTWQIVGLAGCTVLLMLCGMMMYDLLRNMWQWEGPYAINSSLMDTILGFLGEAK